MIEARRLRVTRGEASEKRGKGNVAEVSHPAGWGSWAWSEQFQDCRCKMAQAVAAESYLN